MLKAMKSKSKSSDGSKSKFNNFTSYKNPKQIKQMCKRTAYFNLLKSNQIHDYNRLKSFSTSKTGGIFSTFTNHKTLMSKVALWLLIAWTAGTNSMAGLTKISKKCLDNMFIMSSQDLGQLVRTSEGFKKTSGMFGAIPNTGKPVKSGSLKRFESAGRAGFKRESAGKDGFVTDHTVFHTPDVVWWGDSLYEIDNVSNNAKEVRLDALDANANVLSTEDYVVDGRGSLKGTLKDLFPDYFVGDVSSDGVKMFTVNVVDPEPGKLFTNVSYEFSSRGEKSSVTFNGDEAYHVLNTPHVIPGSSMAHWWWFGYDINNVSDFNIDVKFVGDDGSEYILVEDLAPGSDRTGLMKDLIGLQHTVTAGEFRSYVSDGLEGVISGEPIDALSGLFVYGPRASFTSSEGWVAAGAKVDGTNTYSTVWSVATGVIGNASSLNHDGDNWLGVAFNDKSHSDNVLVMSHYGLDGGLIKELTVYIDADSKVAFLPEDFGFDSTIEGQIIYTSTGLGDMIHLRGSIDRSFMGGGKVASDVSKYLEVESSFNAAQSGVLSIMNPTDDYVNVDINVLNGAGVPLSNSIDNILIAPHGSVIKDHSEYIGSGWDGKIQIKATGPVRASLDEYTISTLREYTNMNGKQVMAVNGPDNIITFGNTTIDGIDNAPYITTDGRINMLADITADLDGDYIDHVDVYVNNEFTMTKDVGSHGGSLGFNFDVPTGDLEIRLDVHNDDHNTIVDGTKTYKVRSVPDSNVATFTYSDKDGNPTDTLKVNEPFTVHYKVENFTGQEIEGMVISMTPGVPGSSFEVEGITPGQTIEGDVYVENGIRSGAQDIVDIIWRPGVSVIYTGSTSTNNNVYEDGEFNLAAEKVYTDIPEYKQLTQDNIEDLATITSREGVLVGGTTQMSYDQLYQGWTNVVNDPKFSGITLDDTRNHLTIKYSDGNTEWFDLGGQTYFAEQNVDDTKIVYVLDQQ